MVYDVEKRKARRLLEKHLSVRPGPWIVKSKLRTLSFFGGLIKAKLGVDGIALDPQGTWLYYAPMTQDSVYRIETKYLKDESLSKRGLADKVERYGPKPLCDGIEMDAQGNLYITDVEHGSIMRIDGQRRLKTFMHSPLVRWPDGMSAAANGYLYVTDSDLGEVLFRSKENIKKSAPFYIYRIKIPE